MKSLTLTEACSLVLHRRLFLFAVPVGVFNSVPVSQGVLNLLMMIASLLVMAKRAEVWRRRHADELAGRKATYYKTPERLAEEADVDEDDPDAKDIYDTGDNVRPTLHLLLIGTESHVIAWLCVVINHSRRAASKLESFVSRLVKPSIVDAVRMWSLNVNPS